MRRHCMLLTLLVLLACEDPTGPGAGVVRVSTQTLGEDPDVDGYRVTIDATNSRGIGLNERIDIAGVEAGEHHLELGSVAPNCLADNPTSASITVDPDSVTEIAFVVHCEATGIEVITRTTGVDQPSGGYLVEPGGRAAIRIEPNARAVFSRFDPGAYTVRLIVASNCSVAGTNPLPVTVANRKVATVTFDVSCTLMDRRIAFVRTDWHNATQTYVSTVMTTDGAGTNVVDFIAGDTPAWSPDGTQLAYSTVVCGYYGDCGGNLEVRDMESGATITLHDTSLGIDPAWSRDGRFIAYSAHPAAFGNRAILHVAASDGSSNAALETPCAHSRSPSWSPDGQRLVFRCEMGLYTGMIAVIARDGSGFTPLTDSNEWVGRPSWSPDGTLIAFAKGSVQGNRTEVHLVTPSGTGIRILTQGLDAAWAPDGSKLLVTRPDGVYVISADGSSPTRLVAGSYRAPAWRP